MTEKDLKTVNALPGFMGPEVVSEALKRKRRKMMLDRGIPVGKDFNADLNSTRLPGGT